MTSIRWSLLAAAASAMLVAPASAATFMFTTTLSSAGEPVPTSLATGSATVSFDDVAKSVAVSLSYAGLASTPSAAHIHCCTLVPGSGSAGVLLGFSGLPTGATNTYSNTFTLTAANFDALLAGTAAGQAYVNVHTPGTYAGGEIRGFLAPVPEPESWAMMLAGLAAVGAMGLRRQARRR